MATKSLSTIANENHLRNEISLLTKEIQGKDETIKKLDSLIEKLQEDATTRRQALDARTTENVKQHAVVEEQSRELSRLQTQVSQLRSRLLDQTHDSDLESKNMQAQLESLRRKHEHDLQEIRSEHLADRKKKDIQASDALNSEVESRTASLREKNESLCASVASLRVQVESLEAREFELRAALSDSDREARALRVELRRAQGGTPLVTDVVLPNPIEKTIHGLERKVDRLKGNMISQTEELTKTSGDKTDLKARVRELQLLLDEAQKSKTQVELDKADTERRLNRKIEDLEAKLATKAREAKDRDLAVQKAQRAKSHVEDKDVELAAHKDEIDKLKSELTHARLQFDAVTDKQRAELSEERAKVEKLELRMHVLQTELDAEKRKLVASKTSQKQAEDNVRKMKLAQEEADRDSDKLAARVARLEKNLRDMERATLKV